MKLLHRYIFSEVLNALGLAVGLFVFILVTGNAMRDALGLLASGRLGIGLFLELAALLVPYVISYALPLGMTCAVLIVFGRLSAQKEIVAMRASGMTLLSMASPALLVSLLAGAACVGINLYYAPAAKAHYRQGIVQALRSSPLQFLQPRTFITDFPEFRLYIGAREEGHLKDVWIWELDEDGHVKAFLKADEAYLRYSEETHALELELIGGIGEKGRVHQLESQDSAAMLIFKRTTLQLPLDKVFRSYHAQKKLSMLTLPELLSRRTECLKDEKNADPQAFARRISIQFQIQKNLVMAFALLSLALIAIPLAIETSRKESYANVGLALALSMLFYFLIIAVGWLEGRPHWRPDILVWIPSFLFQGAGGWMLYKLR